MNRKKRVYILDILVIFITGMFFIGCKYIQKPQNFIFVHAFEFSSPNGIRISDNYQLYPEIQPTQLFSLVNGYPSLDVFDLKSKAFVRREHFNIGSISSGDIRDFYFHNKDSVFFVNVELEKIHIASPNIGGQENSFELYPSLLPPMHPYMFYANGGFKMAFLNKRIFLCAWYRKGFPAQLSHSIEFELQMFENSLVLNASFCQFPEIYKNGKAYNTLAVEYISRVVSKDEEFIYSFPVDHNLRVFKNGFFNREIDGKSQYISDFMETPAQSLNNVNESMKMYISAPYYYKLIFDKFRNYYYRIAVHSIQIDEKSGKFPNRQSKPWSILIFNENLEKIGETFFEPNSFFWDLIVLPEGILIKPIEQKKLKKDILEYQLFTVE